MQESPTTDEWPRTLRRPHHGRMIAGVAAGVADYFDVDVALVRIALAVLAVAGGIGVPLYLAGWLLVPDEDEDEEGFAEQLLGHGRPGGAWCCCQAQPSGTAMASAPRTGPDPERSDDGPAT